MQMKAEDELQISFHSTNVKSMFLIRYNFPFWNIKKYHTKVQEVFDVEFFMVDGKNVSQFNYAEEKKIWKLFCNPEKKVNIFRTV